MCLSPNIMLMLMVMFLPLFNSIVKLIDIVFWLRDDDFNKDKMCFCIYFLLFYVSFTATVQSSTWNNYIF